MHIKGETARLNVPPKQTVEWLSKTAMLWYEEVRHGRLGNQQAVARRANGSPLEGEEVLEDTLRDNEPVFFFMPDDLRFMSLGR